MSSFNTTFVEGTADGKGVFILKLVRVKIYRDQEDENYKKLHFHASLIIRDLGGVRMKILLRVFYLQKQIKSSKYGESFLHLNSVFLPRW
ncbi:hypothetical protein M832_05080 [Chlamydia avium 10DC88]|uniref:Uncharacterized protein n=1 Tax=Chlamydia avium 10DC88 TaxID=1229831 RepID=W8JFN1_9CHLA|nr:hypothetical protein M832_05080 [Chlamydia avium 10DC88]